MLHLRLTAPDAANLDVVGFRPDAFADSTTEDVQRFRIGVGARQVEAGEVFQIEGDPSDGEWRFEGDLSSVHRLGEKMRGGTIEIDGDVGDELGAEMRRGLIVARGTVGELAGYRMRAGTILTLGAIGRRVGAEMRRGTIGLFGDAPQALLPTFRYACDFEPTWLAMLARKVGTALPRRVSLFNGDLLCGGRGEVLATSGEA